jgi:hypothetical protein
MKKEIGFIAIGVGNSGLAAALIMAATDNHPVAFVEVTDQKAKKILIVEPSRL